MLDLAQEAIGAAKVVRGLAVDPAAPGKVIERDQGLALAQLAMSSARDQLLRLHEKLDLADAATPELDVVSLDRDLVVALIGRHLPLHRVDISDGAVVEIFSPDEGRDVAQELLPHGTIAGARARLDHRGALPVLSGAFVVVQRREKRDRDLGGGGVGPQAQIGAEHVAVGGALLHQLDQIAREPDEQRTWLDALGDGRRLGIVEHDQIDIARVVELECAHLAHGEHDVTAALLGLRRIARLELAVCRRSAQEIAHG